MPLLLVCMHPRIAFTSSLHHFFMDIPKDRKRQLQIPKPFIVDTKPYDEDTLKAKPAALNPETHNLSSS